MSPRTESASLTDVGRKRRINQDSCGEFPGSDGALLLVCCDGMGGHEGGEIASGIAVETIGEVFGRANGPPDLALRRAFEAAHARVQERATQRTELRGMGTTGVALYFDGRDRAWLAHVGDSRIYRLRSGVIEQLTVDHSVIAELLRSGRITPEQAEQQPHNELTRAIGASPQLEVDTAVHELQEGDRFVLCSDGLWNMVEAQEITRTLLRESPQRAVKQLVDRANECGGTDNITIQLFVFGTPTPQDVRVDPAASTQTSTIAQASTMRAAETRVVSLDDVDVDEIWESAQAAARAKRDRNIRFAIAGATVAALLLLGALVWLGGGGSEAAQPAPATPGAEVLP
jgi:protein phosphatase